MPVETIYTVLTLFNAIMICLIVASTVYKESTLYTRYISPVPDYKSKPAQSPKSDEEQN